MIYKFKRDVLLIVAKLNNGVRHPDCATIKRQTMFVQSQLFHSIYHDPVVPEDTKKLLMEYHLKSVRATIGDLRGSRSRDEAQGAAPHEVRDAARGEQPAAGEGELRRPAERRRSRQS
ncbi:hypothetical protein [Thauera butanivorans]|uniref:hypothetical protein n=1 Tax=Thauera butanivorans TaxID=86174 RepID=UPI000AD2D70C|nr:hypothetical protein [Thauera butanivorans]